MDFIKWLQASLNANGAGLDVDGDWGKKSIAALKAFQIKRALRPTGVADTATVAALKVHAPVAAPPVETMPPWMAEMNRRRGLHEVRDKAKLIDFLKIGKYLGDPAKLPWCGDAIESCFSKTLPEEPVPSNPFWAQGWAKFGRDAVVPIVGAVGVIKWSATSGHVGIVAGIEGSKVVLLGGNQSNEINLSAFDRSKFMAFRWPSSYPVRHYPAMRGSAPFVATEASTR